MNNKIKWKCKKCGVIFNDGEEQEITGSEITHYQCPNRECNAPSENWEKIQQKKKRMTNRFELLDL